jgi:reductive dehalogenase
MIFYINLAFLLISSLFFMLILVSAIREHESRAVLVLSLGFCFNIAVWMIFLCFAEPLWIGYFNRAIIGFVVLIILISGFRFFPVRPNRSFENVIPFDERDHMFSRNNLKFHEDLFKKYYRRHPQKEDEDRKIHRKPELGDSSQIYYDQLGSPIFDAAFSFLNKIRPFSRGQTAGEQISVDPVNISRIIKKLAFQYGAVDVGITRIQPRHLYSHSGRHAENWGKTVTHRHRYAVVIVVAMNEKMIRQAPSLPVILESSHQYVEAAKIAFIIAEYIRLLGYDATAHTDGNYETLCVPMAIESGLGELGRLGILMHRRYGPCVRLSVITTDIELVPGKAKEMGMVSFCRICKKCSRNCPTKSIPDGEEPFERGFFHWSIKQEKCFAFWKKAGTDCGFCIRVCPFTKPDSLFHRLVRFYVSRNPINQKIALFFDDLLYGKRLSIPKKNPGDLFELN